MERGNQSTVTEDSGELALLEQDDEANQASEEFGDADIEGAIRADTLAMAGEQDEDSDERGSSHVS